MIHNISYRTFIYGTEDEKKVIESINYLFPNSLPKKTITEDHFNDKILVLTDKISKKRETRNIISFLNEKFSSEDKTIIKKELKNRMDHKGNLFLRFDKQYAYENILKLTYSGDAIHIKIKIASYPVSKENAIKLAFKLFDFL